MPTPTPKALIGGPDPSAALLTTVQELRRSIDAAALEAQGLRRDVELADKRRAKENTYVIAVGAALILPILLMLALGWQSVHTAKDARDAAERAKATSDQIASCTTPSGKCYQDGNKRTSGAVQNLVKAQMAIAECAKITATDAQLEACVARRMKPTTP